MTRDGDTVFEGATTTARMRRTVADLVGHLVRAQDFPDGVVLPTGTGVVPDLDFTLREGDVVDILVERVGRLSNPVGIVESARGRRAGADF